MIEVEVERQEGRFDRRAFRRLLQFTAPLRGKMLVTLAFVVVGSVCQLAFPWFIKLGIDRYVAAGDVPGLLRLGALMIGVLLVYLYTETRYLLLTSWIGQQVLYRIRRDVFGHMQQLSFRFYDSQPTGKIISRLTSDVRHLQEFLTKGLIKFASESFVVVGIVVAMFAMHMQLAIVALVSMPVVGAVIVALRRRIRRAHLHERETMANIYANAQEAIAGVRIVQSHARQEVNEGHFAEINDRNLRAALRTVRLAGLFNPTVEVTSALAVSLVLVYGVFTISGAVPGEPVTVGVVVAFIAYLQQFYAPVRDLSMVYNLMQSAMASAERIFEVLDTRPQITDRPDAYPLPRATGDVVFDGVEFGYRPDEPVLRDVNLHIPAGQTVALVGPTGAGKSTIVNLLCRFYDPTRGRVLVDGHDLRDVRIASLREQIAVVPQDPFLFSRTVRENICYGRTEITQARMVEAARMVGAHDFISSLPQGYDTAVAERGEGLSAGQRQLLSFVRALLLDPAILVLDEATSNIDTATELLMQRALEVLLEGRTAFVVAHRLSTIRRADRIVVVDGGRIAQVGTHDELLAQPGVYQDLNLAQRRYASL